MKFLAIISIDIIVLLFLSGFKAFAIDPVVTVRFANPEYLCTTQIYSVDVEFQCNTANVQIFGMNVRFFYEDNILEFTSFGEFAEGYSAVIPNPPTITTGNANGGMALFGFSGPQEYVNGAIEKTSTSSVIISTSGWTKIFNISFHVDDPGAFNIDAFCPSLVWDLVESGNGGIAAGIVITVVNGGGSAPSIEHCVQFNWQYDGVPGLPHGNPVNTNCINTICTYAPDTQLPTFGMSTPGPAIIPVTIINFDTISGFNLTFEYDSVVMSYVNHTPNPVFSPQNGLLTVTNMTGTGSKKKILMQYDGNVISLNDNAHLTDLQFNYNSGTTLLTWVTGGNECEYTDANGHEAYDLPLTDYYINGKIVSLNGPFTKIDSIVGFSGNYVTFSIKVWNFTDIRSGHLTLNYNSSVLVYNDGVPNNAIASTFQDVASVPGTLVLDWSGSGLSLPDGSVLAYLTFQYTGGNSAITWNNSGSSCQYVNADLLLPLNDTPTANFYSNGQITNAAFVWTGQVSNNWNTATNWSGNIIPYQPVDVRIDPGINPPHWPVYNGDLTIGDACNNISILGSAQMTITGDMNIAPGHNLDVISNGHLFIGGDWVNSGIFNRGSGSVEFTGNEAAMIAEGVSPENYIMSYKLSAIPKVFNLTVGAAIGSNGDDTHQDVNIGFGFNYLGTIYTQVRLNTNGWLSFNLSGTDELSYDNMQLFTSAGPTTVLAPWWDNLRTSGVNNMRYITEGMAPYRIFTAEWRNLYSYNTGATTRLSFQVKLYESSGVIEFCYGTIIAGTHNGSEGASIGMKDATGGPGHFIEATQNSSYVMVPVMKSTVNWPTVNYRFTPSVETNTELFYRLVNSKTGGTLDIQKDVNVTGVN